MAGPVGGRRSGWQRRRHPGRGHARRSQAIGPGSVIPNRQSHIVLHACQRSSAPASGSMSRCDDAAPATKRRPGVKVRLDRGEWKSPVSIKLHRSCSGADKGCPVSSDLRRLDSPRGLAAVMSVGPIVPLAASVRFSMIVSPLPQPRWSSLRHSFFGLQKRKHPGRGVPGCLKTSLRWGLEAMPPDRMEKRSSP